MYLRLLKYPIFTELFFFVYVTVVVIFIVDLFIYGEVVAMMEHFLCLFLFLIQYEREIASSAKYNKKSKVPSVISLVKGFWRKAHKPRLIVFEFNDLTYEDWVFALRLYYIYIYFLWCTTPSTIHSWYYITAGILKVMINTYGPIALRGCKFFMSAIRLSDYWNLKIVIAFGSTD